MKKPQAPCGQHCPDRSAECRITCEKWKKYESEMQAFRDERAKTRNLAGEYDDYMKRKRHRG